jgi:hypothetical protein
MNRVNKSAREFIERFRREKYKLDDEGTWKKGDDRLLKDLTNAVENLSKGLYEKDVHFLLELIQNAEDNSYGDATPELSFVLLDDDPTGTQGADGCLCIFNNEVGFTEENIESISSVGASTKKKVDGYIGEKGIGFKSVFIVSSAPHIYSNGFAIKFLEDDPDFVLKYIVPYWLESVPKIVRDRGFSTSLLLPLKAGKKPQIIEYLRGIKAETILFLKKLEGISIETDSAEETLELLRSRSEAGVTELLVQRPKSEAEVGSYWLHTKNASVPPDLNEEKREGIQERVITIAFPLSDNAAPGLIYAYLPTEVDSGLPFLINADFILTANRESIQVEREWNVWLQGEIVDAVVSALLQRVNTDTPDCMVYGYVPIPGSEKALPDYFRSISEAVADKLREHPFVWTDRSSLGYAHCTRFCPPQFRALIDFESRPAWFKGNAVGALEAEAYQKQLGVIGVESLSSSDVLDWLEDAAWLAERTLDWFVDLYRAMASRKWGAKRELAKLSVIPLEGGGLGSPNQRIYWPDDQGIYQELATILPEDLRGGVTFVNKEFYAKLSSKKEAFEWAEAKLGITQFSFDNYLRKTLLPWLRIEADRLDEDLLLSATRLIIGRWFEVADDTHRLLSTSLPLLLDSGHVSLATKLQGRELLVPRAFDPETGWQVLFADEDCDGLDILSDAYVDGCTEESHDALSSFFEVIAAERFPDFPSREFWRSRTEATPKYVASVFSAFREDTTADPRLETWIAPSTFSVDGVRRKPRYRAALIHWLEAMLENRSANISRGVLRWFYRSAKARYVHSALFHDLTHTPWVKTSKGLKPPKEVFWKTKQAREFFGARLPYLEDKMSKEVAEFLGIKIEVTADALMDLLSEFSSDTSDSDLSLLEKIYQYLDDLEEFDSERFKEESLIYVGGEGKRWCTANEAVWVDSSAALGSMWRWLSGVYSTKLKSFFIEKLGVAEDVDDEAFCRAWLRIQEYENDRESVEIFLNLAMPRLSNALAEATAPSWITEFTEHAQVWTQDRNWQEPDSVYVGDDRRLAGLFGDQVYLVWKPDSATHAGLNPLYSALGVAGLSASVTFTISAALQGDGVGPNMYLTDYSKWLICYALANAGREGGELFDRRLEDGRIAGLIALEEVVVDELVVNVSIGDGGAEAEIDDAYAFIDHERQTVYIELEADIEEVKGDLSESIARELWGSRRFRDHIEKIQVLLGVNNETIYRKRRGRHDWHLSRERQAAINELFDNDESQAEAEKEPDGMAEFSAESAITISNRGESSEASYTADDERSEFGDSEDTQPSADGPHYRGQQAPPRSLDATTVSPGARTRRSSRPHSAEESGSSSSQARPSTTRSGPHIPSAGRGQGRPQGGAGRLGKARSSGIAASINQARRNRMRSYVVSELTEEEAADSPPESQQERARLGELGELEVQRDLEARGYEAERMPPNNPGYDIEAKNKETGEIIYVEVKGDSFDWSDKGVGLSRSQYQEAVRRGGSFFLAVVENLRSHPRKISYIQDPVAYISEYRFDSGWAPLATEIAEVTPMSPGGVVDGLKALTDSDECKSIIDYCESHGYPLPEVGAPITDSNGEVLLDDLELAWPEERIGVVCDQQQMEEGPDEVEGWRLYEETYVANIQRVLDSVFQQD